MLMGRDGSIANLDLAQDNVEVPVGEYSPYELSAVMKDPAGGEPWAFDFGETSTGPAWSHPGICGEGQCPRGRPSLRHLTLREARQEATFNTVPGGITVGPGSKRPITCAPGLLSQRQAGLVQAASRRGDPLDDPKRRGLRSAQSGFS